MIVAALNHLGFPFGYATSSTIAKDLLEAAGTDTVYIIATDPLCAIESIHKLGISSGVVAESIRGESLIWAGIEPPDNIKETVRVLINGDNSSCHIARWRRFSTDVERFISTVILPDIGDCDEAKDSDFQQSIESAKLVLNFINKEKAANDLLHVAFDISSAYNQANKP